MIFVVTLYTLRNFVEFIQRRNHNQIAPAIPLHQLPSIHISEDEQQEIPTIKFNNQLNPELVHSKFLIFIVILLMIGMIPFYWLYFSKKTSTIQLLEHLFELGFPQALIFVSGSLYPYITNKSLQKFITEYFKR